MNLHLIRYIIKNSDLKNSSYVWDIVSSG